MTKSATLAGQMPPQTAVHLVVQFAKAKRAGSDEKMDRLSLATLDVVGIGERTESTQSAVDREIGTGNK